MSLLVRVSKLGKFNNSDGVTSGLGYLFSFVISNFFSVDYYVMNICKSGGTDYVVSRDVINKDGIKYTL